MSHPKRRIPKKMNEYINPEAQITLENLSARLSNKMYEFVDYQFAFHNSMVFDQLMSGRTVPQAIRFGRVLLNPNTKTMFLCGFFETCFAIEKWRGHGTEKDADGNE